MNPYPSSSPFGDIPPMFADNAGSDYLLILILSLFSFVMLGLFVVLRHMRRPRKQVYLDTGLGEDLPEYPPPATTGNRTLRVRGRPERLRLVVVAPVGRGDVPNVSQAERLLNLVMRGLGDVAKAERADVKVWPSQLSNKGFAPTFFRLVRRPEQEDEHSHWVLIAGPATASGQKILLGIALWSDEATELGNLSLEPHQWNEVLDFV